MNARWEDIESGAEPPPLVVGPVTRTDFVRYQGASGDFNPVHHDELFARDAGFPGPLGVGMFPAGVMNSWATAWLGPDNVRRTRIRWKAPIFPGDTLTFSGKVVGKHERDGERTVELELQGVKTSADSEEASITVVGWMTFVVPD